MSHWSIVRNASIALLALSTAAASAVRADDAPSTQPALSPGLHNDIEYAAPQGEKLLLDAYVPATEGLHPIALIVHGGGWSGGDRTGEMKPIFQPLSDANFTWFTIEYRMGPKYHWPACQDDVATAIRWVKAHAKQYRGDPDRIALIGESAGGQLVCRAAAQAPDDARVQAVVGFAAPTDLPADVDRRGGISPSLEKLFGTKELNDATKRELREMSAIDYATPDYPPTLLLHGTADTSVLYSQSTAFQAKLRSLGVPCELVTIADGKHTMQRWRGVDDTYKQKMIAWLERTLRAPMTAAPADANASTQPLPG